jgi:serine/threonine-protein kinase ULK/ATG1
MSKLTKKLKENLDTEISILKSLQHPHIVAMFSLVEKPVHFYLIMEYCQLSDLSQFMKKRTTLTNWPETADIFKKYPNPETGGLHEVLARHFLKQIASALEYLRRRNLIHRDIKPQNLLLNPSPLYMARQPAEDVPLAASEHSLIPTVGVASLPMLKIADFGFARHLPSTSMAETLCGSPLYMAPEILRYEKYDARADLWSVGTVLYEMVVGKPPFRAQNHVELLRRIEKINDVIIFDKSLSIGRDMKTVIRKLLRKSPLDRLSYEDFFQDPVITGEIPGLVGEDRPQAKARPAPDPEVSELSRRMAKQSINAPAQDLPTAEQSDQQPALREAPTERVSSRRPSFQDDKSSAADDAGRRRSSGSYAQTTTAPRDIQRRTSQRERRPSIVAHATAPGRQELYGQPSNTGAGTNTGTSAGQRLERRPSRASPLSGPPMVREQSVEVEQAQAHRAGGEKVAQDIAFEKEYVVIEKRQVEVNAFADELDANATRSAPQSHGAMIRRATTQGQPNSVTGAQPSSPSRGMQMMTGRAAPHHRTGSFERRYVPSPQSATNMLTKALNAANVRIFGGALGTSPPFGKGGASPPRGYSAYPTYPTSQGALTLGDGSDARTPLDEDTKIVRIVEEAGHRSDVVFGFAEVKYRQLLPATPSAQDGLGIQQLGNPEGLLDGSGNEEDKDMTNNAIVGVAEEALVLYVKTLSILAKTIDLAGFWWSKQPSRGDITSASPRSSPAPSSDTNKRMNNVVQWARSRFNECLEKSEIVGRRLVEAQKRLPADHPGNPNNYASGSTGSGGAAISTSREQIQLTTDVTAEKLMFERAVEMSRASALNELVGGEELADCELGYVTSIMLFEAVLETEDEPLMRKPSAKKDVPADGGVAGLEGEERATVVKRRFLLIFPHSLYHIMLTLRSNRRRPQPLVHS